MSKANTQDRDIPAVKQHLKTYSWEIQIGSKWNNHNMTFKQLMQRTKDDANRNKTEGHRVY